MPGSKVRVLPFPPLCEAADSRRSATILLFPRSEHVIALQIFLAPTRRSRVNSENSQARMARIALQPSRSERGSRASVRASCSNSTASRSRDALNCDVDPGESVPATNRNASPGPSNVDWKNSGTKRATKNLWTGPSLRHAKFLAVSFRTRCGGRYSMILS